MYDQGNNVYYVNGQGSLYSDTAPTGTAPLDPTILVDLTLVVQNLDNKAATLDVNSPWTNPNAAAWGAQTLETYINSMSASPRFRKLASVACRPIWGAEARDLSMLFVLFYIASSGDEQVSTENNLAVAGKRVIVAIPPALAGRTDYEPLLPESRDQLMRRLGQAI